jgi:hypothetical protein
METALRALTLLYPALAGRLKAARSDIPNISRLRREKLSDKRAAASVRFSERGGRSPRLLAALWDMRVLGSHAVYARLDGDHEKVWGAALTGRTGTSDMAGDHPHFLMVSWRPSSTRTGGVRPSERDWRSGADRSNSLSVASDRNVEIPWRRGRVAIFRRSRFRRGGLRGRDDRSLALLRFRSPLPYVFL